MKPDTITRLLALRSHLETAGAAVSITANATASHTYELGASPGNTDLAPTNTGGAEGGASASTTSVPLQHFT